MRVCKSILFQAILCFAFTLPLFCCATNLNKIDSLKQQLISAREEDKAAIYNKLGALFVFNQPDSGIYYAQQALSLCTKYNNKKQKINSLIVLGDGFQYKSVYDKSTEFYIQALALSLEEKTLARTSTIYNAIGINYYYFADYARAKEYMLKSAAIQKQLGKEREYAMCLTNCIGMYQLLQQYDSAFYYGRVAEKTLLKEKDFSTLGNLYNSIGSIHQTGTKNLDSAEFYYKKAARIFKTPELEQYAVGALNNLGQIETARNKIAKAKLYLDSALALAIKYKRVTFEMIVYNSLSEMYKTAGDYKNAYEYYVKASTIKDSTLAKEKQETIAALETKFKSTVKDKKIKEQEVELIARDLQVEKEKNKSYLIIVVSVIIIMLLIGMAYVFWLRKRTREIIEQEKSRFFSNIVHEFRTPLTLIKGPLEELKTSGINEEQKNNLLFIERNSNRLLALVNQLLDVSKVEAGKFILNKNFGNVSSFIEQLTTVFKKPAQEAGINFSLDITHNKDNHLFSPDAIEKIITNLFSNALKYTNVGGTITIKAQVDTTNNLLIEVSDTGCGIPAKDIPYIFNRFYQAGNAKQTGGTGLGLSLTKELVDLMQGTITINSEIEKGTSLFVKIPMENEVAITSLETEEGNENCVVVLVEDDRDVMNFVSSLLQKEKITVHAAVNGEDGLKLIDQFIPDIVITDVMMPVMDGLEFSKRIKSDPITSHIPVIGLSAKLAQESKMQGLHAGMDAYLGKPFHPNELILLVNNLVQTIKNNQRIYKEQLKEEEKPYKERIKGKDEYIGKAIEIIDKNIDDSEFSVNELADALFISRSQLHRKIKTLTGLSTTHFIRTVRLEKAKDLLKTNSGNVTEVAYLCGFSSQSYFTKSFADYFGYPPSDLVKK
jgi:two-component system sensor histidine kinase ChiS